MTDPYRPRRAPVRVADLRDLTLGEVAERAKRHGHFVVIATLALVVAVFFPGEVPITRSLLPSGGLAQGDGGQVAEVLGEQVTAGDGGVARAGGRPGAGAGADDSPAFNPFRPDDRDGEGGGGSGGGQGGDDDAPPACASDGRFPEPVIGPTLEQARAAQTAVEEGVGRPFPVDLVGTVGAALCGDGSAGGADVFGDLLVLGTFVPDAAAAPLLLALEPVVSGACDEARNVALIEALALQRVSPATLDALDLCGRVAGAQPPVGGPGAPGTPAVPGADVPVGGEAPAPATPVTVAPSWSSPAVLR